jgi:predicted RNA-binding Zn ribbon-like protein
MTFDGVILPGMLRRLGGHPVLDFVNTIDPRDGDDRVDYLHTFADLVDWAYRGGIVSAGERRDARREASRRRAAAGAFRRAIALREAIYALFGAVAAGQRLPPGALARLEAAYREAVAHASLTSTRAGFRWHIGFDIDAIRWRIAQQAVALLESDRVDRIKRCPGSGDCGWLFLDGSKNASRRWCSMEGCGNRSKVRRFAGRRRRTAP